MARNVLVMLLGLSPAVITETIYALVKREEPWIPDELHLITTAGGEEKVDGLNSNIARLCQVYGDVEDAAGRRLDPERLKPQIRLLRQSGDIFDDGSPALSDINDDVAARSVDNQIADYVVFCAKRRDTVIHASLAGGRKTMSSAMSDAANFAAAHRRARMAGDEAPQVGIELSHILIEPERPLTNPTLGFWFPEPDPEYVFTGVSTYIKDDAITKSSIRVVNKDIRVHLHSVPVKDTRPVWWNPKVAFDYDLYRAWQDFSPTSFTVFFDAAKRSIYIGPTKLNNLEPKQVALYLLLLETAATGKSAEGVRGDALCPSNAYYEVLGDRHYEGLAGSPTFTRFLELYEYIGGTLGTLRFMLNFSKRTNKGNYYNGRVFYYDGNGDAQYQPKPARQAGRAQRLEQAYPLAESLVAVRESDYAPTSFPFGADYKNRNELVAAVWRKKWNPELSAIATAIEAAIPHLDAVRMAQPLTAGKDNPPAARLSLAPKHIASLSGLPACGPDRERWQPLAEQ